ncbi:GDSL esterase/lipase EXL3 [Citrus sinensis]|nr:GDSL esterase/lipase EXL3 [Citrus sinensis]
MCCIKASRELQENEEIPALMAFGDSILDTGNNNDLISVVKCNFPPYGMDFIGGKPTGRFCDGKVLTDLIAEGLGIKETVPAYLDPNLQSKDLPTGDLYGLGVRKIGVLSTLPLGCLPIIRTLHGGPMRFCGDNANRAAQLFNSKLLAEVNSLNSSLPQAKIVYVDVYNPLLDLIKNPVKSGFRVPDRSCCGTGLFEAVILCNQLTPFTCDNVSEFVFWDSAHPSERAYRIMAPPILQDLKKTFS